jgi:valyl-tRNA synthetase
MNIAPGKALPVLLRKGSAFDKTNVSHHQHLLKTLAKVESIVWLAMNEVPPPQSATAFVGELEIFIPMTGFINKEEETARLNKEIIKLQKDLMLTENKLQNPQFVDKAPSEVVAKERAKQAELKMTLSKIEKQLEQVKAF